MALSDKDIDGLIDQYLKRPDLKDNDDPISHAAKLLAAAYAMPGVRAIQPELPPLSQPPQRIAGKMMVALFGEYLHAINPTLSRDEWARLYARILEKLYGGTYVRIRKRPKLAKLLDADRMTLEQWQVKHGGSRRHYFSLRKEAHQMKMAEAIASRQQK